MISQMHIKKWHVHNGSVNMSKGKDKDEVLQEEKEDEGFQEATKSNMSSVGADTESDCTPVNSDMSDSSSMSPFLEHYMSHSTV